MAKRNYQTEFHPEAIREIRESIQWYRDRKEQAADEESSERKTAKGIGRQSETIAGNAARLKARGAAPTGCEQTLCFRGKTTRFGFSEAERAALHEDSALKDLVRLWSTMGTSTPRAIIAIVRSANGE